MEAGFVQPSLLAPPLRQDVSLRALESLGARISHLPLQPVVVYDFDRVPASALPALAQQFNVLGDGGWDLACTALSPDAAKRALLKEAVHLHRIKGTPYALRRALDLLGVRAQVIEWFAMQPPGPPHTFALLLWAQDQPSGAALLSDERLALVSRVVHFWKPERSHVALRSGLGLHSRLRVGVCAAAVLRLGAQGRLLPLPMAARTGLRAAAMGVPALVVLGRGVLRHGL